MNVRQDRAVVSFRARSLLLVSALAALLAGASSGCARTESPAAWAKRLAATFDNRSPLERMNARDAKAIAAAVKAWRDALQGRTAQDVAALDLLTFVVRYEPIWSRDSLQEPALAKLTERAKTLDQATIAAWKRTLEKVHGDGVSELWTAALLVSVDRLFGQAGIKASEAATFETRLGLLPAPAVAKLSELLGKGKADVALLMADHDALFGKGSFNQAYFDEASGALQGLVKRK